jgi:hypothetical protein
LRGEHAHLRKMVHDTAVSLEEVEQERDAANEDAARLAAELNSYCGHDEQAASPRQAIELHRARLAQTNDD